MTRTLTPPGAASVNRPRTPLRALLGPAATAGTLNGAVLVVIATSLAAFVFTGPLSGHLAAGIGITLLAQAIVVAIVALGATVPTTTATVQESSAAILGVIASAIAARMVPTHHDPFLTVVLAVALTSVCTGAAFLLLGTLRLGDLIRFVPYPVVAGFLAGTGWLLTHGAIEVLTGVPLELDHLAEFFSGPVLYKWLAGAAVAVTLLIATRRYRHIATLPVALAICVAIFYVVLLVTGHGMGTAQRNGWLLGPFEHGSLWRPWIAQAVTEGDWGIVGGQAGSMATAVLVTLLAFLLNASAMEVALSEDVDLNRDLRATGLANLAGGLAGGVPGFHSVSLTVVAERSGARSRVVALASAAVCVLALFAGARLFSLFPTPVVGGLLLFIGLSFLVEWVYDARRGLHIAEYLLVLLILVVIAALGYLPGVALGLVAAIILFTVTYARLDFIRHTLSGVTYQSRVERSAQQREVLQSLGDRIWIVELQGFLFFGTARRLLDGIARRVADPDQRPLGFLVLDFRRVTGHDTSAVMSFVGIRRLARRSGFDLVLTALPDDIRERFAFAGLVSSESGLVVERELDRGVQWCEDRLLAAHGVGTDVEPDPISRELAARLGGGVDVGPLIRRLVRREVPRGHEVIRQGDPADEVYFVESGRVTVELSAEDGRRHRVQTMGPGSVMGELPLYLGSARAASVIADDDCVVYGLSFAAFAQLERDAPEVAAALHRFFAQLLARRLTDSLQSIQALLG